MAEGDDTGFAVTQLLTAFTIFIEIAAPLLLFWPLLPSRFLNTMRYVCIVLLIKLQIGE